MTRAQHQVTDDVVIEETHRAGVFRRRRIGLVERWADEGIVTEKELAAAEAFQAIFDRAQLRERYAVSSSLIDRVDGGGSATPKAFESWSLTSLRERLIKTGARMVRHARYAVFQMAEAALPRAVFAGVLDLINGLRGPPAEAAPS